MNALEIKATLLCLKYFIREEKSHVRYFQTTAISCINKNIISVRISGDKNIETDRESRELVVDLEWMLCSENLWKALMLLNHTPRLIFWKKNKTKEKKKMKYLLKCNICFLTYIYRICSLNFSYLDFLCIFCPRIPVI